MRKDYSRYSLDELYSALSAIDREKYPENYRALTDAIEVRKSTPQEDSSEDYALPRIASPWRRLGAVIVDALIWSIPFLVMFSLIGKHFGWALIYFTVSPVLYLAYQVFFHVRFGATPGKMFVGIRIVRDDFQPIGFGNAIKRSFVDIILQSLICFASIRVLILMSPEFPFQGAWFLTAMQNIQAFWVFSEFFVCIFNKRRKAIHDYIASTLVVKVS